MFGDEEEENTVEVKIGADGFRLIQSEVDEDTQNPHSALGNLLTYALTTDVEIHAIEHVSISFASGQTFTPPPLGQIHAKINLNERGKFAVKQVSGITLTDDGGIIIETAETKRFRIKWEEEQAAFTHQMMEAEQRRVAQELQRRMSIQQARRPKRQSWMDRSSYRVANGSSAVDQPWDSTIYVMKKQHSRKGGKRKR
jgi:hypothetical protein